jgi:chromosomal replication initiator protein
MDLDINAVWVNSALPQLKEAFTDAVYDSFIQHIVPCEFENSVLVLKTHMDFFKITLNTRYIHEISRLMRELLEDEDLEVRVVSPEDFSPNARAKHDNYAKTNLRSKYLFDNFVLGKCNEFAYGVARAIAKKPDGSEYNPFFVYGGVGLGKTHLIHAIGNYIVEKTPELKVLYVSTEKFTNEFLFAMREKTTQEFKKKYREVDVLLLDDIQFLEGKESTQEEMFHTFNTLHNESKHLVFTSDKPPKELTMLEQRLTSRFSMGLTVDITLPDYETRTAILERKLDMEHISIPQNVKEFITRNIVSNIRDLEGALNKIVALSRLSNMSITLEIAKEALKHQVTPGDKPEITVAYIQEVVKILRIPRPFNCDSFLQQNRKRFGNRRKNENGCRRIGNKNQR